MRFAIPAALISTIVMVAACGGKRAERAAVTSDMQAAAMELGFATGSMLSQVALPLALRKDSFAGFARGDAELRDLMRQVRIGEEDATETLAGLREGFGNEDPMAGASRILSAMNRFKDSLAAGDHPALMHVFRVGFVVGHTLETAVTVTRGDPKPEHLRVFVALTGRYRTALPDDLARADLPAEVTEAVRRTSVDVQSVEDLQASVGACLTVKDLVAKMRTSK